MERLSGSIDKNVAVCQSMRIQLLRTDNDDDFIRRIPERKRVTDDAAPPHLPAD